MTESPAWLRAGRIGRPHGLDGSFHVGEPVSGLLEAGTVVRVAGRELRIVRRAGLDARPILRLEGCEDRPAAEALRGEELQVARARVPELGEDEWRAEELEGCTVKDGDVVVGVVNRLLGLPSCEVLEVERTSGGASLLVPLVADAVRTVDVPGRSIDIDLRFLGEE